MDRIADVETARQEKSALHAEWWAHYSRLGANHPATIDAAQRLREYKQQAIRQFAKPEVPGCKSCEEFSVFGGPNHHASVHCRSGRHPHCTCDTCF